LYGPSTTLAVMQLNLGSILTSTGRAGEAAEMLVGTVAMAAKYSGEQSPVTVNSMLKLARARLEAVETSAAEKTVQRALDIGRARFGEHHLFVAEGEAVLARIRRAQGRTVEARSLAERSAATLRTLGPATRGLLAEVEELQSELVVLQR
jgi:Tetratricopeptide repeat